MTPEVVEGGRLWRLVRALLWRVDAETAHDLVVGLLALAGSGNAGLRLLRRIAGPPESQPVQLAGLTFPNRIGVAAGLDKNARAVRALAALGFGHVETGTLTPRPQPGNPRPRVFRLPEDRALINRMGFPNCGVGRALPRLARLRDRDFVLGVSLGKQKETPLEEAAADYVEVLRGVYRCADYLAVNVSSPNTPGLRTLQSGAQVRGLLEALRSAGEKEASAHGCPVRPLFLKIAPDLNRSEVAEIAEAARTGGAGGIIATNTLLARPDLRSHWAGESGGLSGAPLRERSLQVLRWLRQECGDEFVLIASGGIMDPGSAVERLEAGADLLQAYTGFVYGGPMFTSRLLRGIAGSV